MGVGQRLGGMRLAGMLALLLLAGGCSRSPEAEPTGARPGAGDSWPPSVEALVVRQGDRTHRLLAGKGEEILALEPDEDEVWLSVEATGRLTQVQYLLEGRLPGHVGPVHGVVTLGDARRPARWAPLPGTLGRLYALVWYEDGTARRSPSARVEVPMPPDLLCPDINLPAPPPVEVADWGQSAVDEEQNLLYIEVPGETAFVPLTTDPDTCKDRRIAAELRFLQKEMKRDQAGLGVAVRRFLEQGGFPGVDAEHFWLARARIEEEAGDRVVIAARLVARALADNRAVEGRVVATRVGGRWSVRLAADGRE